MRTPHSTRLCLYEQLTPVSPYRQVDEAVKTLGPGASGEVVYLASFDSIIAFATRFAAAHASMDTLVDNAGVAVPPFCKTAQGFEARPTLIRAPTKRGRH